MPASSEVAKDVVALAAGPRVVVLLEIGPRKCRRSNAVELGLAVLLEGFANHLGRQARLHVPEALDRVIAILDLRLVLVLERFLGELLLKLRSLEAALQFVALLFDDADGFGDRELLRDLDSVELGLQPLDLRVLRGGGLLQFVGEASPRPAWKRFASRCFACSSSFASASRSFSTALRASVTASFSRDLTGIEPGLQFLDLGVLGCGSLLQFAGDLGLGELDGVPLVLLGQFEPLVQLLLELVVANLLQDVRIPGLVDLEGLCRSAGR